MGRASDCAQASVPRRSCYIVSTMRKSGCTRNEYPLAVVVMADGESTDAITCNVTRKVSRVDDVRATADCHRRIPRPSHRPSSWSFQQEVVHWRRIVNGLPSRKGYVVHLTWLSSIP